jgi:hypothetical protein
MAVSGFQHQARQPPQGHYLRQKRYKPTVVFEGEPPVAVGEGERDRVKRVFDEE